MNKSKNPIVEKIDARLGVDRTPLTKENFFNHLYEVYPRSVQKFCDFIDDYKEHVGWLSIIPSAKFHDLPYAMQMGIWFEFVIQRGGCQYEITDVYSYDLRNDITLMMQMMESQD